MLTELCKKIELHEARLGIIGLGYAGLPVACMFADAGFEVIGVDVKPELVALINAGRNPIGGREPGLAELLKQVTQLGHLHATTDYADLRAADVVLVDVETPVDDEDHKPRYTALKSACTSLGAILKAGALVIIESTIAPGTVERVVRPVLEETTRQQLNVGFFLGHCPERVMPGKLLANLRAMHRVCGGSTPETAEAMVTLYRTIVWADLDAADCVTAELVKTAENAYRDVNIAFANELALVCETTGGDFMRVRELVNKSPGRNVLLAGAGVGGHCIPKDPWLLAFGAGDQVSVRLIKAAREVNESMPQHVSKLAVQALHASGQEADKARVVVLGYSYLKESDDTRNSPSAVLVDCLRELVAEVIVHDPWVSEYQDDLFECLKGADAAILMVAHETYRRLDLPALRAALRTPVLIDGRRVFEASQAQAAGIVFRGIGQGSGV